MVSYCSFLKLENVLCFGTLQCGYQISLKCSIIPLLTGMLAGNLGEVLVRCNNVLYVRGVEDEAAEEGQMA